MVAAVVPLKSLALAKGRLSGPLPAAARIEIATAVAGHVLDAAATAGLRTVVVAGDDEVAALAHDAGAEIVPDSGGGLDTAAATGIAAAEGPWLVVHGDLPLITAETLASMAVAVDDGLAVIAPSVDGGTNVLGGRGMFSFAYGPSSFHRHLSRIPPSPFRVIVSIETAVEVDTIGDLAAAARSPGGSWLQGFLS